MRHLLTALLLPLLVGCAASNLPPAGPTTEMIDQADRIILVTDDEPKESYKKIGQYLTDQGFAISQSDSELLTIQTEFKTFMKGIWSYNFRVSASVRDTAIHFYGQTGSELLGEYESENRGGNNSEMKNSWEKLVEIAKGYPHQQIYYSRN